MARGICHTKASQMHDAIVIDNADREAGNALLLRPAR
jgi:hypothetical protein